MEPVEQVTPDMLLGIIGAKEVEIQVLRGRVNSLTAKLKEAAPVVEKGDVGVNSGVSPAPSL